MNELPAPLTRPGGLPLVVKGLAYVGLPLIAVFLALKLNMQVIQADIIYKTGFQFDAQNQPQLSIPLYQRAIAMSPGEDYYYLFLGRSYLNTTNALTDEAQRQNVLSQAEKELKVAQQLNPLNPDHTANLARLNRQWAAITSDTTVRDERIRLSNQYYESVLHLSRNSVVLWGEWSLLAYEFMNDFDLAQQRLDHSFALDTTYEQTYLYQGDLFVRRAQRDTDPAKQQDYYQRAITAYLTGIEAADRRGLSTTNLRIRLADAYVATGQLPLAIEQYITVGQFNDPAVSQWQLYQQIADLYRQLGDIGQARQYAQLALDAAPDANKPQVQQYLDTLK
jgi:tetratricopeptide (TPR) repeat protein